MIVVEQEPQENPGEVKVKSTFKNTLRKHHIQVHALLLLVALVHVHVALVVPLVVWIPDVIVIIVIIVLIFLQLVRNLGGGELLGVSLSCPETKKIFFKTNYMILLTVFCVLRI